MSTPLLAYLINEAAGTTFNDTSTGTPVNVALTPGASGAWTSAGANKVGYSYGQTATGLSGSLTGTKVQTALTGATAMTVEMVVDTAQPGGDSYDSYLKIADGSDTGIVGVTINHGQGGLIFSAAEGAFPNDCLIKYAVPTSGIYVLHVVIDSTQAVAANRVLVYINGSPVTPTIFDQLGLNATLDTGVTWSSVVLSMGAVGAAPQGSNYYSWLYALAMPPATVAANAAALAVNNDANPNVSALAALPWVRA